MLCLSRRSSTSEREGWVGRTTPLWRRAVAKATKTLDTIKTLMLNCLLPLLLLLGKLLPSTLQLHLPIRLPCLPRR